MDFTSEHKNWLAAGEIIALIREPVSAYVDEIVKAFHAKLVEDFDKNSTCAKCTTASGNLCSSCQNWWLRKLEASHKKGKNPSWQKNCKGEKWYSDHWEVAKFFIPALGTPTVKDAASTDLSSLLNVLDWMTDEVFPGKKRVNVDLVRKLRSDVRNRWAHSPKHEVSDQQKKDYFQIAADFLEDLKNVFPNGSDEIEETKGKLQQLEENGVSDLVKSEIEMLLLNFSLLNQIQAELTTTQKDELEQVKNSMEECSRRMKEFEKLRDHIATLVKENKEDGPELVSCLPEKPGNFTGREKEIEDFMKFFHQDDASIVSLHGGPGFGKSALAVEVSWRLHVEIPIIFSHLSTASTIDEVILALCRDVGLNPEDDPTSSLILWLKKLHDTVVFVLDDIDELLDKNRRSEFDKSMCLLRKNSNQNLKIITTSRASYTIRGLTCRQIRIEEMDEESSLAFLQSTCFHDDTHFLKSLAELCGYIPLAMCIASSLANTYEEPEEILEHLRDQPMDTLKDDESNQFVYKTFNTSYLKLNEQQIDAILRLAVFEGSFTEEAAKAVLEGNAGEKQAILTQLVNRSLVKKEKDDAHRFTIHLLVKRFLIEKPESGEKRKNAEKRMVAYYLELGNTLTIKSYSKDGFETGREALKKEAHNFENVFSIVRSKQNDPEIQEVLTNSEIYKTTCRFFYFIARNIISEAVLKDFLQSCADVADQRNDKAKKMNFECILADYEGRKSLWKSSEYLEKMEKIEEEYSETTGNDAERAYFLYQLARYNFNKYKDFTANGNHDTARDDELLEKAEDEIRESLKLRKSLTTSEKCDSSLKNADVILSLLQLGSVRKKIATRYYYRKDKRKNKESMEGARKYYEEAIQQAEEYLGEHEETSACYTSLGHLFFTERKSKNAMEYYKKARHMRETLKLDTSEAYVYLLNNIAKCLMFTSGHDEATEILEKARDLAEKLAGDDDLTSCKGKVYASLAENYWNSGRNTEKAKEFANKARTVNDKNKDKFLNKNEIAMLEKICKSKF